MLLGKLDFIYTSSETYLIHLECFNLCSVLFSTSYYVQVIHNKSRKHNIFLESAMEVKSSHIANGLITNLLENIVSYRLKKDDIVLDETYYKKMFNLISNVGCKFALI